MKHCCWLTHVAVIPLAAVAHDGHGHGGAHWHATDAWGFVALAVAVARRALVLAEKVMIPGELYTDGADHELNPRRRTLTLGGREHRRPPDPGRLALSLRRDERRVALRPRRRRAACA